jgi:hypothetical protein
LLACAFAAQADLIVSSAHDLCVLGAYQDTPIVAAVQALRRIEAEKQRNARKSSPAPNDPVFAVSPGRHMSSGTSNALPELVWPYLPTKDL